MQLTTQRFIALLPLLITSATVRVVMLAIAQEAQYLTFGLSVVGPQPNLAVAAAGLGVPPIQVTPLLLVDLEICLLLHGYCWLAWPA
jgi:NADH-quinone oxidoreductase subunit N